MVISWKHYAFTQNCRNYLFVQFFGDCRSDLTHCRSQTWPMFLPSIAGISRLDDQIFINRNPGVPSVVKFHPFNTCIAVADKDSIWWEQLFLRRFSLGYQTRDADPALMRFSVSYSFWDWEKGERLDYFYNGNPRYTRITAMEYLNGHDCSLLLTATGQEHDDRMVPAAPFLSWSSLQNQNEKFVKTCNLMAFNCYGCFLVFSNKLFL